MDQHAAREAGDGSDLGTPARRERVFNIPAVVLGLILACVGIHAVRMFLLTSEQDWALVLRLSFIPIRYSGTYLIDTFAFVGPVSYSLLHGSLAHLAVNMVWLAAFGSPLAHRIGAARFLLFWVATSLAAVGLHYLLHASDQTPLVGASGAISGMMGAAARFGFRVQRFDRLPAFAGPILPVVAVFRHRTTMTFLIVWFVINFAIGFGIGAPGGAQIAWEAHIGGFLLGFFGIRLFDRR